METIEKTEIQMIEFNVSDDYLENAAGSSFAGVVTTCTYSGSCVVGVN